MKIAITARGETLDAALDPRFGRAGWLLLVDPDTDSFEVIDNAPGLNAEQGAGVQAAEAVVQAGARVLITGHCGPKAFRALNAAGVMIYTTDAATVAEALARYQDGELTPAAGADVSGHWAAS